MSILVVGIFEQGAVFVQDTLHRSVYGYF